MKGKEERRCALTGDCAPPSALLRFVLSPAGRVVFDLRQDLPGEDVWLAPNYELVSGAARRGLFHGQADWPEDMAEVVAAQLRQQALGNLALLRRSGALVAGFEKVKAALEKNSARILVQASDAAEDGKAKLARLAGHLKVPVIGCFLRKELEQVTGQDNQVHLAVMRSGLSNKFIAESHFLMAYLGIE